MLKTRFKDYYNNEIRAKLMAQFNLSSVMQAPKFLQITVNMGVGLASTDKKVLTAAMDDLAKITGQRPMMTRAKKSIAGFKIREGWPIGCKVTLRKDRMYEFLERLIMVAIPRIRDFRGLKNNSFDGRGNYNFGIKEQIVFPEIEFDKIDMLRGLDVCISTSARTDVEAKALLEAFNFPFKK